MKDRRTILEQLLFRDTPAIEKQQRRNEEQEENLRIEVHPQIGGKSDHPTKCDLHERPWNRSGNIRETEPLTTTASKRTRTIVTVSIGSLLSLCLQRRRTRATHSEGRDPPNAGAGCYHE